MTVPFKTQLCNFTKGGKPCYMGRTQPTAKTGEDVLVEGVPGGVERFEGRRRRRDRGDPRKGVEPGRRFADGVGEMFGA